MRTRTASELAAIHFDAEQRMHEATRRWEEAEDYSLEERRARYIALADARSAEGKARRRLEREINGESSFTDIMNEDNEIRKEEQQSS